MSYHFNNCTIIILYTFKIKINVNLSNKFPEKEYSYIVQLVNLPSTSSGKLWCCTGINITLLPRQGNVRCSSSVNSCLLLSIRNKKKRTPSTCK